MDNVVLFTTRTHQHHAKIHFMFYRRSRLLRLINQLLNFLFPDPAPPAKQSEVRS